MIWEKIGMGCAVLGGACLGVFGFVTVTVYIELEEEEKKKTEEKPQAEKPTVLQEAVAAVEKKGPVELHVEELARFVQSVDRGTREEFQSAYKGLEHMLFSNAETSDKKVQEIKQEVGNRMTLLLMWRNRVKENPLNAMYLSAGGDEFLTAVKKTARHLPVMGQEMCFAKAKVLVNLLTKGVCQYSSKAG